MNLTNNKKQQIVLIITKTAGHATPGASHQG